MKAAPDDLPAVLHPYVPTVGCGPRRQMQACEPIMLAFTLFSSVECKHRDPNACEIGGRCE